MDRPQEKGRRRRREVAIEFQSQTTASLRKQRRQRKIAIGKINFDENSLETSPQQFRCNRISRFKRSEILEGTGNESGIVIVSWFWLCYSDKPTKQRRIGDLSHALPVPASLKLAIATGRY